MALTDDIDRIKAAKTPMKLSTIQVIGCVLLALMIALFGLPLIILTCCLLQPGGL